MYEQSQGKQSKFQDFMDELKHKIFAVMQELLKNTKIGISILCLGKWYASFLILISFIQLIGYLFDPGVLFLLYFRMILNGVMILYLMLSMKFASIYVFFLLSKKTKVRHFSGFYIPLV